MNIKNTNIYILKENVLTDDLLIVPQEGYKFKGGIIAIVKQYSYQNCYSDKETIIKFKNKNSLFKFIDKHYKDIEFDCEIEF